jgi:hypothetical protein
VFCGSVSEICVMHVLSLNLGKMVDYSVVWIYSVSSFEYQYFISE